MQGNTKPDYLDIGFEQIDRDLRLLMEAFAEVLRSLGHAALADHLPWTGSALPSTEPHTLPGHLGLAYSVAFQILNMVEENAASAMRELREEHEGLEAEHGMWGRQLARLDLSDQAFGDLDVERDGVRQRPQPGVGSCC